MGKKTRKDLLMDIDYAFELIASEFETFVSTTVGDDNFYELYDQLDFLISEIKKKGEELTQFGNKNVGMYGNRISEGQADRYAEYYSLVHILYTITTDFKEGKTDLLEKFKQYDGIEERRHEFIFDQDGDPDDFPEEAAFQEYKKLKDSYVSKFKNTLEYKRITESANDLSKNVEALLDVLDVKRIFYDHPEYHDQLETDDPKEFERIEALKFQRIAEEQEKKAEKERLAKEQLIKETEKDYEYDKELLAKHEKAEESGEYKKDIDDEAINSDETRNYIRAQIARTNLLQRNHPEMKELAQAFRAASKNLSGIHNSATNNEASAERITTFIILDQLVSYAFSLKDEGNMEKFNELVNLSRQDIGRIVGRLREHETKKGIFDKYIENLTFNETLNNRRRLISLNGNKEMVDSLNSDLEIKMLLGGNYEIKKALSGVIDSSISRMEKSVDENSRIYKLFDSIKAEMQMLKDEVLVDGNNKVTDGAIHKISRVAAISQIMLNDAEDKEFLNNLDEAALEEKIGILADYLEKSNYIKDILKGEDIISNGLNLIELVSKPGTLAQHLNELDYSKKLFTGKEALRPGTTMSEFEKQLRKDKLERIRMEEEKALKLSQMKDGYYDVGKNSYYYAKQEFVKTGDALKALADKNNQVFSLMSDAPIPTGKTPEEKKKAEEQKALQNNLKNVFGGLTEVSQLLISNGNLKDNFGIKNIEGYTKDSEDLTKISARLDNMIESCSNLMEYEFSDEDDFKKLYSSLVNARGRIDEITSGSLCVPDKEYIAENGIKATFIDDGNPDLKIIADKFAAENYASDVEVSWVGAKEPLFPHDPCSKDIIQGNVGDCYFVATLASIASKSPQTIRDMMTYNQKDDTVTVRFYNTKNEPVYVTVPNTVPEYKYKSFSGDEKVTNVFSAGARWVQIMEKAFQKSGLAGRDTGKTTLEGGLRIYANKVLLGPMVKGLTLNEIGEFHDFKISQEPQQKFPQEYQKEDLEIYNKLKSLHESGIMISGGVKDDAARTPDNVLGLPGGHAYGITGFSEENGVKYVHIKNPHGGPGRTYDGKHHLPKEVPEEIANGESKLELRDFLNNFDSVAAADVKTSPLYRSNEAIVEKESMLYSDTIREMDHFLQECSKIKSGEDETLPKQLIDLRKKSTLAVEALKDPFIRPNKLNSILANYFNSAREYVDFRDKNPLGPEKEKTPYAALCYFSANVITKLHSRFLEHQIEGLDKAEPFDVEDLKTEAMKVKDSDSPAKKASVEKMENIISDMETDKRRQNELSVQRAKELVEKNSKLLKSKNVLGKK